MDGKIKRVPDYNVKIKEYAHGTKFVTYADPVCVLEKKPADESTGTDADADAQGAQDKHEYMDVPRTPEQEEHSVRTSINRTKTAIYDLAMSNDWEWFVTLTFNPDVYDSTDYDNVVRIFKRFINTVRGHYAPDLVYLYVPELHKDGKKFHLHGVMRDCGRMRFVESGHYDTDGEPIYNLANWKYGFSTASMIKDTTRASAYITKYMTKETVQVTKNKHRYYCSKNIKRPEVRKLMADYTNEEIIRIYDPDNISSVRTPVNMVTYFDVDD